MTRKLAATEARKFDQFRGFFAQETERRIGEWGNPPAWKTLEIALGS
jgi:hypothetical protein